MRFASLCMRVIVLIGVMSFPVACTTDLNKIIPDRRPDYRESQTMEPLEVPPDLTASTIDDTLLVPELNPTGTANLSDYASERAGGAQIVPAEGVLQKQPGIRMERDGNRRWLIVQQNPQQVWPKIKEFWSSNGLVLKREDPRIGIMETDWAENRADIADGPIRAILSKALDFAYSAPTRDKFRVRLERLGDGTAVYLTHYGVEEVVQGGIGNQKNETTLWQSRPPDPELEAEMLNRLMVYLGASERRAEAQLAKASTEPAPQPIRAQLTTVEGQQALLIKETYPQAWRLVGLALDGSNFVVEDQNRAQGRYVVEYSDPLDDGTEKGLLSKLAFWKDEPPPPQGVRYQVRLAGQGPQTVVIVQDVAGQPDNSPTAKLILESLLEDIR